MMDGYTAEEEQRISQLVDKIAGLIHDHSHDEIISALASIYIGLWAGACCANHRKTMSDDLASDIPKMLEAANRRAHKRRIEPPLAVLAGGKHYLSRHKGAVIAECERCGEKRLFATKIKPEWLKDICLKCQNESDVESPLTFRMPTKIEVATMTPDEELSRKMAERHE